MNNKSNPTDSYLEIRKHRGLKQKLYLIELSDSDVDKKKLSKKFIIMGSTGNVYQVCIKNTPTCTCPDYKLRKKRCKHIYFVLIRIMNVSKNNEDIMKFTDADLLHMFSSIPKITKTLYIDNSLKEIYKKKTNKNLNLIQMKSIEDLCLVCLDELDNGEELDYCKYSCGKPIHKDCYNMWFKAAQNRTKQKKCLFCQKPWDNDNETDYINLT